MKLRTVELCLFAYGGVHIQSVHSLIAEMFAAGPEFGVGLQFSSQADDALISRSRSRAATNFLERTGTEKADVLVMLDHDIVWRRGDAIALAKKAADTDGIVGGYYPCRGFKGGLSSRVAAEQVEFNVGGDKLHEAMYVATGFTAYSRRALERIVAQLTDPTVAEHLRVRKCMDDPEEGTWFWDLFRCVSVPSHVYDGQTEYLSEDWAISHRAKECGVPLYLYEKPVLTHFGLHGFKLQDGV